MGNVLAFPAIRRTEVEYSKTIATFIEETKVKVKDLDSSYFSVLLGYWLKECTIHDTSEVNRTCWWWSLDFSYDSYYSLETHQFVYEGEIADWCRQDGHETRGTPTFCKFHYTWGGESYVTDWSIQKTIQSTLKNWSDLVKRKLGSTDETDLLIRRMVHTAVAQGWIITSAKFPNVQDVLNGDFVKPVVLHMRNKDFMLTLEFDYFNYRGHWVAHPDCILDEV